MENNFENKLNVFRNNFGRHYQNASTKFEDAINEIDKIIKSLQQMKTDLLIIKISVLSELSRRAM